MNREVFVKCIGQKVWEPWMLYRASNTINIFSKCLSKQFVLLIVLKGKLNTTTTRQKYLYRNVYSSLGAFTFLFKGFGPAYLENKKLLQFVSAAYCYMDVLGRFFYHQNKLQEHTSNNAFIVAN